jgi:hypothetical protein
MQGNRIARAKIVASIEELTKLEYIRSPLSTYSQETEEGAAYG